MCELTEAPLLTSKKVQTASVQATLGFTSKCSSWDKVNTQSANQNQKIGTEHDDHLKREYISANQGFTRNLQWWSFLQINYNN